MRPTGGTSRTTSPARSSTRWSGRAGSPTWGHNRGDGEPEAASQAGEGEASRLRPRRDRRRGERDRPQRERAEDRDGGQADDEDSRAKRLEGEVSAGRPAASELEPRAQARGALRPDLPRD